MNDLFNSSGKMYILAIDGSYMMNKKVLLRERKRHTARHVVSTPSVVLPGYPPPPPPGGGGGGVTGPGSPLGGYRTWVPPGGGGGGYLTRVPPPPPRGGGGGVPDLGTPPPRGVPDLAPPPPPPPGGGGGVPDLGTPPPPPGEGGVPDLGTPPQGGGGYLTRTPPVWTDKQSETITFPSYYVRGR